MNTLKIVIVQEQADATSRIREILEDSPFEAFAPQSSPESFDLSQCLRVLACGDHLSNAEFFELSCESAFSSPGNVLTSVIVENFFRQAIGGDASA